MSISLEISLILLIVSLAVDLGISLYAVREPVDRKPVSEAEMSRLLSSVPPAWLVCVRVLRDGRWVGSTRGLVRFVGNALEFEGDRTSFRVGSQDVAALKVVKRVGRTPAYQLQLVSRSGIFVQFEVLRSPYERDNRVNFHATLNKFLQGPPTDLERSYPPITRWQSGQSQQDALVHLIE